VSLVNNTRPCAGDVVVHKGAIPAGGYVLSVFRHASQLSFGTRDEANGCHRRRQRDREQGANAGAVELDALFTSLDEP
jgi:hypothetical protein